MRRLIAVFMLALLPFQFSWSAVAAYCTHENTASQGQHVGHHEHTHEAENVAGQSDKSGQNADPFDVDCWVCHGAGFGALNYAFAKQGPSHDGSMGVPPFVRLVGVAPNPPERPQWLVLA